MAGQVGVGLEPGVAVGREHFAVGVNVDAVTGGLIQQVGEFENDVAGDEDARAGFGAFVNCCWLMCSEFFGMTLVE